MDARIKEVSGLVHIEGDNMQFEKLIKELKVIFITADTGEGNAND